MPIPILIVNHNAILDTHTDNTATESDNHNEIETGCYVAIATSKEVRLSWETLIDTYVSADSLDTQPNENWECMHRWCITPHKPCTRD
ncbi:hypothetical protein EB796_024469 [Bugula neritina]|uniref:Uncharacterized protein n=1 Tax=Bugula neritina TaxID=10212 RepID=A0A7J7IVJ4_BUGNE|nr:hypothetical protein EB796_024469 [Bugula neritina]